MIRSFILLMIFSGFIGGKSVPAHDVWLADVPATNNLSVITIEDDVIMGNTLSRYGILCEDANVQGNPHDGFMILYVLPKGTTVELREQSHGADRSWVMIKPAEYIKLEALCNH